MNKEADTSKNIEEKVLKSGLKQTFLAFFKNLQRFFKILLSIKEGTNIAGTIEEVHKNVVFKGPNVWILVCSIFIASVGLNVNSTAIIIGAMLIAPLMGPIIGIGLSVGTNDMKFLKKSFKNFGIMIIISIVTSFVYFYITPLSEAQSELFARTKPTLLDVIVALFGGLAGIIAGSRDEKTNVIPGVAIATALMPPLCTAGYGLATLNWGFFFGAFYLFLLNSVFIFLATVLVVRYLRFPMASFVDEARERSVKRWITTLTLLIIIPSGFIFWGIVKESIFKTNADEFISKFMSFENTEVVSKKVFYNDTMSTIEVFLIGEIIPESRIKELNIQMNDFGLAKTRLKVNQAKDESNLIVGKLSQQVRTGIIEDLYKHNEEIINSKEQQIRFLEQQLLAYKASDLDYDDIKSELQAIYDNIETFSYAKMIAGSYISKPDTVFTFLVTWNKATNEATKKELNTKLKNYLEARLKIKKVKVLNVEH